MKEVDELAESRTPPNPPRPRISWFVTGSLLAIIGLIMSMTVIMTASGLLLAAIGLALIVGSFITDNASDVRKQSDIGYDLLSRAANALKSSDEKAEKALNKLVTSNQQKKAATVHPFSAQTFTLQDTLDDDERINEAIDESFPASDPPSWNSGVERHAVVK